MGCCSATAPATPIVSPPKGFRLRCSSCSSTNACAARSPIAASTTAPTPSTSRPANSKPPTTAPTKPFNRSSISWPLDLSAAIVELFLSTILRRRIYRQRELPALVLSDQDQKHKESGCAEDENGRGAT